MMRFSITCSVVVAAALFVLGAMTELHSENFYWDADAGQNLNQNGSGFWTSDSGGTLSWSKSLIAGSHVNVAWINGMGHTAVLGATSGYTNNGVGGTLTLTENISLARFDKSSMAGLYTISAGSDNYHITLTKGSASTSTMISNNNVNANGALMIDAVIYGTEGFTKGNGGKVILARDNTISGKVTINASGSVTTPTSVLQMGNGGTTGTLGTSDVEFASDGVNATQSIFAWNRSDRVEMTNRLVSSTNAGKLNKGILQQMGTGTLVLAGNLDSFYGGLLVTDGQMTLGEGNTSGSLGNTTYIQTSGNGAFVLDRTDDFTFDRELQGNGVIRKKGNNILTVLAAPEPSTFSGLFELEGGTLFIGESNALSAATTLVFNQNATLDLNGQTQTLKSMGLGMNVTGTVIGSGASHLILSGADWTVGGSLRENEQVLDMTQLARFTYDSAAHKLQLGTKENEPRNVLTVKLAQSNLIRAKEIGLASVTSGLTLGANRADLLLGQENELFADSFLIGGIKSDVNLKFNQQDGTSFLTVRATDGVSRASMVVGKGESGSFATIGRVDLSGGTSDLLIDKLVVGENYNRVGQGANTTGLFVMGQGTLDANQIILGEISNVSEMTTYRAIGNLEIREGGLVRAAEMIFGNKTSTGAGGVTGAIQFYDGTLALGSLKHGSVSSITSELVWRGGNLTHYDASRDLTIQDVTIRLSEGSAKTLQVGTDRTISILSNMVNTQTTPAVIAFTKTGSGTLVLGGANSYTGRIQHEAGKIQTQGNQALSGGFHFTGNARLELGNTQQTLNYLGLEAGLRGIITGNLLTVNSTTNFDLGGKVANTTTHLDLSNLERFEWRGASANVRWGSTLNLSNNHSIVDLAIRENTVVAKEIGLASLTDGATGGYNRSIVRLGETNLFQTDKLLVGNYKSNVHLGFREGVSNGSFTFTGVSGGNSRGSIYVGITQSSTLDSMATVDLRQGTIQASVSDFVLGRSDNNGTQNQAIIARFYMNQGLLDATNIYLGELNHNSSSTATLSDSQFVLQGTGTVKTQRLVFGNKTSAGATSLGYVDAKFELGGGGTLAAKEIRKGDVVNSNLAILWKHGTIQNYDDSSDLSVSGVNLELQGESQRNFHVSGTRTAEIQSAIINTGTAIEGLAINKTGTGTLHLNGIGIFTGLTKVTAGTLRVSDASPVFSAAGSSGVEVAVGAFLGGNGFLRPSGNSSVINHGTLSPSLQTALEATQFTIDLSGTTGVFESTGFLAFDLFSNHGDNSGVTGSSDRIQLLGNTGDNVLLSGSVLLDIGEGSSLTGSDFAEGDRWMLIDWLDSQATASSVTLNQVNFLGSNLAPGLGWKLESIDAGLYAVVVSIPEPSKAVLALAGFGLIGLRRRR